jgi:hypothetical protein
MKYDGIGDEGWKLAAALAIGDVEEAVACVTEAREDGYEFTEEEMFEAPLRQFDRHFGRGDRDRHGAARPRGCQRRCGGRPHRDEQRLRTRTRAVRHGTQPVRRTCHGRGSDNRRGVGRRPVSRNDHRHARPGVQQARRALRRLPKAAQRLAAPRAPRVRASTAARAAPAGLERPNPGHPAHAAVLGGTRPVRCFGCDRTQTWCSLGSLWGYKAP